MPLTISRILHAGYHFECGETKILFDPIFENPFSRNCYAYPAVRFDHDKIRALEVDAVIISHYHDDHCSFESLNYLNRKTPIFIYCQHDEIFEWLKELGFREVHRFEENSAVSIGEFKVVPRAALDPDVDSIFEIHAGGVSVLNVIDSWIDPRAMELLKKTRWDMILWPFQTMREIAVLAPTHAEPADTSVPPEWLDQLRVLNPRHVVPSSCQFIHEPWSWYNHALFPITYKKFETEVRATLPQAQVVRLDPSVSVLLNQDSLTFTTSLPWVIPQGEQNVDYNFEPTQIPMATALIAEKLEPLSGNDFSTVQNFCLKGLLEKYRELPPPQEDFFENARIWKLSLYDHAGASTDFFYSLHRNKIEKVKHSEHSDWRTELPAAKLFSALKHGEALTSMYLRIEVVEKDVDVMEDPLIRCLFTGEFGGYQREQMRKLRKR